MKLNFGWSWYCEKHNSFGLSTEEGEAKQLAEEHVKYHAKLNDDCKLFLKNQDTNNVSEYKYKFDLKPKINIKDTNSRMGKVKSIFGRAWEKWSLQEDLELTHNFNNRMSLEVLIKHHQRANGGIVARLKKLKLVDSEASTSEIRELLKNRHDKLINKKIFSTDLKVDRAKIYERQTERGRDSLRVYGTVNPPPVEQPDMKHTSMFQCKICGSPVIGNVCKCIGD
jgi:hypothetical protein